jgi:hypothetical protein
MIELLRIHTGMNYLMSRLQRLLAPPVMTRPRIWFAYGVAVATDLLQLLLGPFGWAFVDEVLDVLAMIAISIAIGFHVVLLPTFALEFLPLTDMLPTWTGAVAIVVALRRRRELTTFTA